MCLHLLGSRKCLWPVGKYLSSTSVHLDIFNLFPCRILVSSMVFNNTTYSRPDLCSCADVTPSISANCCTTNLDIGTDDTDHSHYILGLFGSPKSLLALIGHYRLYCMVRHTFDHLKVEMKSISIILAFLLYLSSEMWGLWYMKCTGLSLHVACVQRVYSQENTSRC